MTNIEAFNLITAEIFKELYSQFPRPITFSVREFRGRLNLPEEAWWEQERGAKLNPAGCALIWLQEEGFVRYTGESACLTFSGLVLTSKGLAALNKTPEALSAKPTIGERLKELSRTASVETVGSLVRLALGGS